MSLLYKLLSEVKWFVRGHTVTGSGIIRGLEAPVSTVLYLLIFLALEGSEQTLLYCVHILITLSFHF